LIYFGFENAQLNKNANELYERETGYIEQRIMNNKLRMK